METLQRHIRWTLESSDFGMSIDGILDRLRDDTNLREDLLTEQNIKIALRSMSVRVGYCFGLKVYYSVN